MQSGPLAQKASAEFGGHVLGFRRAAAVSHPQDFVAAAQRFHDRIGNGFDLFAIVRRVENSAPVCDELVETAPRADVYGSIQKSSWPSETSSPFSGTMRVTMPE